jgi:hypothetical protein
VQTLIMVPSLALRLFGSTSRIGSGFDCLDGLSVSLARIGVQCVRTSRTEAEDAPPVGERVDTLRRHREQ